jgi:hypothetical protein
MRACEADIGPAITEVAMRERTASSGSSVRPRLIEYSLLAYPEAFGVKLAEILAGARECVLQDGDAESRERLLSAQPIAEVEPEIARVRRLMVRQPNEMELAAPALVYAGSNLIVIALAHRLPQTSSRLFARLQVGRNPESTSVQLTQVRATTDLLLRWAAIGHDSLPDAVWECSPPSWFDGRQRIAVELIPTPGAFNEAMLIGHHGASRVLVPHVDFDAPSHEVAWRRTSVMPSGWSSLRSNTPMSGGTQGWWHRAGSPRPMAGVRVPDDRHFAMCAMRTWTLSLHDAMWLRDVLDLSANTTHQQLRQGDHAP